MGKNNFKNNPPPHLMIREKYVAPKIVQMSCRTIIRWNVYRNDVRLCNETWLKHNTNFIVKEEKLGWIVVPTFTYKSLSIDLSRCIGLRYLIYGYYS